MIFECDVNGHIMEYIHHLYMGMIEHKNDDYVIVVPKEFEQRKSLYDWPTASNISFHFMDEPMINFDNYSLAYKVYKQNTLLRKYVKQICPQRVFIISLIGYLPIIGFFIKNSIKVSGIIYMIYLYRWKNATWKTRVFDAIKYLSMKLTPCIQNVFILNDSSAAAHLNKLYKTTKFKFLTDPYNAIKYTPKNIRKEIGINSNAKVFLHFGGMSHRKGTLDILDAIPLLSSEKRQDSVFIFAGRVYDSLKNEFYRKIEELPKDARVLVYDEFCSNEFLADLCISSDFILMPYRDTTQSSGLLGYAAHYGIPVIGPNDGLAGKIIRKYKLGSTIPSITADDIAYAVNNTTSRHTNSTYKDLISIDNFQDIILNTF